MSFLSKIFGSSTPSSSVFLVFYDDFVQVAHVDFQTKEPRLIAFNELPFSDDIFRKGEILDISGFQKLINKLFSEAQPSAVKTREVFVNISFNMLFPFVMDFSKKLSQKEISARMMEYITDHSPVNPQDVSFYFSSKKTRSTLTSGALAIPLRWEDRFKKAFHKIGVPLVHFIPESYALSSLLSKRPEVDFIFISYYDQSIFCSVFHNTLLYDTFILSSPVSDPEKIDCESCFSDLKTAQANFYSAFQKDINHFYFVNFGEFFIQKISEFLENTDIKPVFLTPADYDFPDIFRTASDTTLLKGMIKKTLEKH